MYSWSICMEKRDRIHSVYISILYFTYFKNKDPEPGETKWQNGLTYFVRAPVKIIIYFWLSKVNYKRKITLNNKMV